MTEDDVVRIVRAYIEGLFPKVCPNCGRHFASLRDYLEITTHLSNPVLYDDLAGGIPDKPLGPMSYANCPCGTTVSIGSRGLPPLRLVQLLIWARRESVLRSVGMRELLGHIRDRIDAEVLETSETTRATRSHPVTASRDPVHPVVIERA
jgi:hypothetical protein